MGCVHWSLAPAKGSVAGDENRGHREGIDLAKFASNRAACVQNVIFVYFFTRELFSYWNISVKIIGVGGAVGGNCFRCLRPGRCVLGVRVGYSADGWELAVEMKMCCQF